MKARRMVSAMMAVILAAGMSFPSLAADEKIDKVRLSFSYSKEPETGDDIGDISVRGEGNGYTVESAEYTNAEDKDVWTVGDVPEVKVELSADDG